jgi:Fe2+ transport system protein FeoA
MNLADVRVGTTVTIEGVTGAGSFRRRLLELGLLPGTPVTLLGVAPLRDPLELLVRGSSLSLRRAEAALVRVTTYRDPSLKSDPDTSLSLLPEPWAENAQ